MILNDMIVFKLDATAGKASRGNLSNFKLADPMISLQTKS
jgi:hypothetical protein